MGTEATKYGQHQDARCSATGDEQPGRSRAGQEPLPRLQRPPEGGHRAAEQRHTGDDYAIERRTCHR